MILSASGNLALLAKSSLSSTTTTLKSTILAARATYCDICPAPKMWTVDANAKGLDDHSLFRNFRALLREEAVVFLHFHVQGWDRPTVSRKRR